MKGRPQNFKKEGIIGEKKVLDETPKIWYIIVTKEHKIWNILVNIGTQKTLWSKQNQLSQKNSSLASRQIKNQPDKMQFRFKKLPTKQSQIKTNKKS